MPSTQDRAANTALYSFDAAELKADTFQVVRFAGTEALSEPFKFELQLVSTVPDLDFSSIVNRPASFTLKRGEQDVPIHGIVTEFTQRGRTADYVSYYATLEPRLHRLSLNFQSQIFQDASVKEVIQTVFRENGFSSGDYRFALQRTYPPREFCVQFQETDLDFVRRLMEFEGIYYFFEHEAGCDTIVITDRRSEHTSISMPSVLRYHDGAGGMVDGDRERVHSFSGQMKMVSGKVQLKDYNPRTPETIAVEAEGTSERPGIRYEYGEQFRDPDRAKQLANIRREEIEARRQVMNGESNSMGLQSGYVFTLEQHFRQDFNADYLVTQVEHEGSQRAGLDVDSVQARPNGNTEPEYRNQFTCIPASVQYRPRRRTPKPEVPGVLTATVESAGGDYAYIDDEGRYRARMHFDERTDRSDGTKTLPIRMSQPYSGSDYGMHFPNHADTEMLIAFENGDIDRPIALGTTPNPSNKSPAISENKMENILRTFGGNELLMDDTKEETRVKLNSANAHTLVFDDQKEKIELLSTKNHRVLLDDKKKRIEIQSRKGRKILLDDDNEMMSVVSQKGHFLEVSDKHDCVTVSDADEKHVVTLDYSNEKMSLKTEGDIGLEADGAIEMTSRSLSIETDKDAEMNVGGDLSQSVKGNATLEAQGEGTVEAAKALTVSGMDVVIEGAKNLAAEAGMKAELTGTQLKMEGSAMTDVKGGVLKLNG